MKQQVRLKLKGQTHRVMTGRGLRIYRQILYYSCEDLFTPSKRESDIATGWVL